METTYSKFDIWKYIFKKIKDNKKEDYIWFRIIIPRIFCPILNVNFEEKVSFGSRGG